MTGLPRTRGDGPWRRSRASASSAASPHTRGWTPPACRPSAEPSGFPAHAGMDPARRQREIDRGRLPRTRGDGPDNCAYRDSSSRASPHTRGWTLDRLSELRPLLGFPAHAGMDRRRARERRRDHRFPRTRGDGPSPRRGAGAQAAASPHTRGWTVAPHRREQIAGGFPAHAGMDLRLRVRAGRRIRLPRTRGDGPADTSAAKRAVMASPHTRGWTQPLYAVVHHCAGFPAHAGMDPGRRRRAGCIPWLPRTRGDGPASRSAVATASRASPHTRGWTFSGFVCGSRPAGFPAHAGMDRSRSPRRGHARRLPRTRGDGPAATPASVPPAWASPHTRGWTPRPPRHRGPPRGFPAHAGMDRAGSPRG